MGSLSTGTASVIDAGRKKRKGEMNNHPQINLDKTRFRRAVVCAKDCLKNLGYVRNEEEMEARKEFIKLCWQIAKETIKDVVITV
jgi:hypothetical protein